MAKTERIFTAELTVITSADNLREMTPERTRMVEKHLEQVEGFDHVKIIKVQDHTFSDQEKPLRVYISGPISNNSAYMLDFKDAEQRLTEQGYIAVNPAAFNNALPELEYEEYMKLDLALLEMSDAIYLLEGWEQSRGANREYGYALAKGMKVAKEGEDVWR